MKRVALVVLLFLFSAALLLEGGQTEEAKKAKVETRSNGTRVYGPYKGSKQNKGRPTKVEYKNGKTSSTNAARDEKEKSVGRKLKRHEHVAHKGKTNESGNKSTSASSTRVESRKKNVGDGNKTRASRGNTQHRKKRR